MCLIIKVRASTFIGLLRDGLEPILFEHLFSVLQGLVLNIGLQTTTRKYF